MSQLSTLESREETLSAWAVTAQSNETTRKNALSERKTTWSAFCLIVITGLYLFFCTFSDKSDEALKKEPAAEDPSIDSKHLSMMYRRQLIIFQKYYHIFHWIQLKNAMNSATVSGRLAKP
jgi:hypothetical protein